jgi:hypothetical protein
MRSLLSSLALVAVCLAAFGFGRIAAGESRAATATPSPAVDASDAPVAQAADAPLEALLGSPVLGQVGAPPEAEEVPLGELVDVLVDAVTGNTRGCIVAADGPAGPIARRLDLSAEAWEPATRRVRLPLGPRTFASLPEFDPGALEPGTVLASRLIGSELPVVGRGADRRPVRLTGLRVDLAEQRVSPLSADGRALDWTPLR